MGSWQHYRKRRRTETVRLDQVIFNFLGIKGVWKADRNQQQAAWELYVELVTRIAVEPLGPQDSLLREALTSLYSLFSETRGVLRKYGPAVAVRIGNADISFAEIAVSVLNRVLRPLLAEWHPKLLDYESRRDVSVSPAEHERLWEHNAELRSNLAEIRKALSAYADLLARAAGIEPVHGTSSTND